MIKTNLALGHMTDIITQKTGNSSKGKDTKNKTIKDDLKNTVIGNQLSVNDKKSKQNLKVKGNSDEETEGTYSNDKNPQWNVKTQESKKIEEKKKKREAKSESKQTDKNIGEVQPEVKQSEFNCLQGSEIQKLEILKLSGSNTEWFSPSRFKKWLDEFFNLKMWNISSNQQISQLSIDQNDDTFKAFCDSIEHLTSKLNDNSKEYEQIGSLLANKNWKIPTLVLKNQHSKPKKVQNDNKKCMEINQLDWDGKDKFTSEMISSIESLFNFQQFKESELAFKVKNHITKSISK